MRDLPFNDAGEIDYKDSASGITSHASAGAKTAAAVDAAAQSRIAEDEAKHKGMEAVKSAKRELLKHSLEMMVKQELCSADHAARLFERAVRGDVLVDAAIEAYASDKDVVEFLDTLQILANNTPEQLDAMLRSAVRMSDQEAAAGMQRPASAAGGPRPAHASSVSRPSSQILSPSQILLSQSTILVPSNTLVPVNYSYPWQFFSIHPNPPSLLIYPTLLP